MEKSILFANIVNYFTLCTIFTEFLYHFDKNPPIIIPNAQLHKPKGRFFWFVVWFVPDALIQTKGTVLLVCGLVCSRCVDTFTLLFAPKTDQKNRPLV